MQHLQNLITDIRVLIAQARAADTAPALRADIIDELLVLRDEINHAAATISAELTLAAPEIRAPLCHSIPPPVGHFGSYQNIPITTNFALGATVIESFDDVAADGKLYFVPAADHFAIKLCGHMFHGNLGTIFVDDRRVVKIKDCKYANQCGKKSGCDYYHDPLIISGSRDRRNYVASAWTYNPAAPPGKFKRIGSLSNLCRDIEAADIEEINRYRDQLMHDIICMLILLRYRGDDLII